LERPDDAARIARAAARSLVDKTPHQLRLAIEAVLSAGEAAAGPLAHAAAAVRTLRVDAGQIDALVRLTGELTVTKNAIGHAVRLAQEQGGELASLLKDRYADLDRLVTALQRSVLDLRVLPLRHVFQRFPRLVREMSRDLGKPAEFAMEGEDTQADKAIVEMLFEPLLHVLRNAMDHGIETSVIRAAVGKAPVAKILLSATRQGEHVLVEIEDDGRGIDVDKVCAAAIAKGIFTPDTAAAANDAEIVNLIFAPGFSTAARVTGLSGRGVGMDAVRTAVEKVGGQVNIETEKGRGTTVRFTLPFSVMMTRVMTVEVGRQTFGIPLDSVVETVRIPAAAVTSVGAATAIVYRDRTVPLIELASALGAPGASGAEAEITVVVTRVSGQLGALRVDGIGERLDVVLKPLDGLLAGMTGIAGTTLLGDGRVLLILDLGELVQ
jgi:two-component system chemotaxis sensor kinase CheA